MTTSASSVRATAEKQATFLAAYSELGTITHAARKAGIDRVTHYRWMEADQTYALRFRHAEAEALDSLEREARRRAIEGTEEPIYANGKLVDTVRKYSDTLLIFLMKGHNPSRYRERVDVTVDVRRAIERLTDDPAEREAAIAEAERILAQHR